MLIAKYAVGNPANLRNHQWGANFKDGKPWVAHEDDKKDDKQNEKKDEDEKKKRKYTYTVTDRDIRRQRERAAEQLLHAFESIANDASTVEEDGDSSTRTDEPRELEIMDYCLMKVS